MPEFPFETSNSFVGRLPDGSRVFVTLHAEHRTGTHRTINHEEIVDPVTVGFSGGIVEPHRAGDFQSAGQIQDDLDGLAPATGSHWTEADISSLRALWDRWHLNGMKGGCVHVPTPLYQKNPRYGYREVDLDNTPACPETGYRYGHAWLVEPLPDDVLTEVHRLASIPRGNVPAWLER